MIKLLVGPYRSGKTGRLLRELVKSKRDYPFDRCLILVPSQRYGKLVREKLAQIVGEQSSRDTAGIFGVGIATIYDACADILRFVGDHPSVLPRDVCAAVVAHSLEAAKQRGELSTLSPISKFPGTAEAVLELFDEFERAALPPQQVLSATSNTAATESKYRELAKIYAEYWHQLDELKCLDQKRVAFASRSALSEARAENFRLRWLLVDGFDRISPLQAEVIHALSAHAAETQIAFDYIDPENRSEADSEEYGWKDSSYEEIRSRFSVAPIYVHSEQSVGNAEQLAFKTLDPYFEMTEVARRCKESILNNNVSPAQILVVARDLSEYATAARAAFDEARIPYAVDDSIAYEELPLFKLLMKLATLAQDDFPRRDLMQCLRSPFVDATALGFSKQQIESLDKKSLDGGVVGGASAWQAFVIGAMPEQTAQALIQLLQILTPPSHDTINGFARWLETLEASTIRKPASLSTCAPAELEAVQGLRNVLRSMLLHEKLLGETKVSYLHFLSMLRSASETSTFRRPLPQGEFVTICSAEHAPNRRFDEVFVAGVFEGRFPKHTGQSGFVSAEERARWNTFGVPITNPREEAGFEKALFKSLIQRARKRICFSMPDFTASGEEVIPSFFLTDGTASVPEICSIRAATAGLRRPISAREAVAGWLFVRPGLELCDALMKHDAVGEFWQTINRSILAAYQRHQKDSVNAYNGYLVDLTQNEWLTISMPAAWSASALSNYRQCPFKFWVSQMLDLEPTREPQLGLTIDIKGRLYHKALEIYHSQLLALPEASRAEPQPDLLRVALNEAIESIKDDPQFTPGPYWDNEQKDMLFRLGRFVEFDRQRTANRDIEQPAYFEAKFGLPYEASYPALSIDSDYGPIVIRGVIDRIDVQRDADGTPISAAVVDYKTGSTAIGLADAQAGTNLQLPIYALAVSQQILPNVPVKRGHFLSINAAKSVGSIDFNDEKSRGLLDATRELISDSIRAIKSGDFRVSPHSSKICKSCIHTSICRVTDLKRSEAEEI